MANRKNRSKAPRGQTATDTANMVSNAHAEAFTFGDPIPVMDRRE
ncbi:TPA: capsid portal protein, partial [Enterobacter kobei]|nr:capsid portal protein [Enterobacter kobei]